MPLQTLASAFPLDLKDWESLGVATLANVLALYFGDDLFKLLVGLATFCLLAISGLRKLFAAKKEWEEARSQQLENERKELELRKLKHEVEDIERQ
jgi:hypothetical protein